MIQRADSPYRHMLASPIPARGSLPRLAEPKNWIVERKFDGYRIIADRSGDRVLLISRKGLDFGPRYPEVVQALRAQPVQDFAIDGEVVALVGSRTSFEQLQRRGRPITLSGAKRSGVQLALYVFDLLRANGIDTRDLPLLERKRLLRLAVEFGPIVRFTTHRRLTRDLSEQLRRACERGGEGLVLKDGASPYAAGRSLSWLKIRCENRQELVIGGFTDPQSGRIGFGALLVGYYDDRGRFLYAGKVGTGFNDTILRELTKSLKRIETAKPTFADDPELPTRSVHWTKPQIVIEVRFAEWTSSGRLRHPSFLGVRPDRVPRSVRREAPAGSTVL